MSCSDLNIEGASEAAAPSQTNVYVNPTTTESQYNPAAEVRIKQTVTNEDAGYSKDVRSAFSGLPKVKPQWRDYYMKILIVGECGQGQQLQCIADINQQLVAA